MPEQRRPPKPKFTLGFKAPAQMPNGFKDLSVTYMLERPRRVYFNTRNWNHVPPASGYKTLKDYRIYLINHEVGHAALGLDHSPCGGPGQVAPIMMQHTKGVAPCVLNPWVNP